MNAAHAKNQKNLPGVIMIDGGSSEGSIVAAGTQHNTTTINNKVIITSGSNQVDLQVEQALLDLNDLKTEAIKT